MPPLGSPNLETLRHGVTQRCLHSLSPHLVTTYLQRTQLTRTYSVARLLMSEATPDADTVVSARDNSGVWWEVPPDTDPAKWVDN